MEINKFGYDTIIRDIPDFPNYQISENGEVYNKITGKELVHTKKKCVVLCRDGVKTTMSVKNLLHSLFPLPENIDYIANKFKHISAGDIKKFGYDPIIKDIQDFPNYQISENGEVYRKNDGYELSQCVDKDGYKLVSLNDNGKPKQFRVHILVAKTFVKNKFDREIVDHINRIKDDNRADNLRWVSHSQNATNSKISISNKSGTKGICKMTDNRDGRIVWRAYICKNNKKLSKEFPFTDEGFQIAVEWRLKKEEELHTYD